MIAHAKPHAPLDVYATTVAGDWIDYNGHMNDAAYALVFSRSLDALMDRIGLDAATRKRTGRRDQRNSARCHGRCDRATIGHYSIHSTIHDLFLRIERSACSKHSNRRGAL